MSKTLGIVMQEPVLFNRSVYKNIRYNCESVGYEQVVNASKMANALDFINEGKFGKKSESEENEMLIDKDEDLPNKNFMIKVGTRPLKGRFVVFVGTQAKGPGQHNRDQLIEVSL